MNLLKHSVLITAASLMVGTSAFALTSTESQALTQKILASKVIDMPLVAAKLVVSADKADRIETAKAAVVAVAKNHPTALSTVVARFSARLPRRPKWSSRPASKSLLRWRAPWSPPPPSPPRVRTL